MDDTNTPSNNEPPFHPPIGGEFDSFIEPQPEEELTIKMFKLKTGSQIIANIYDETDTTYEIQRPMELVSSTKIQRTSSRVDNIFLQDWLLYCEVADKVVIQKSDVSAIGTPLPQLISLFKREVDIQDNPVYKLLANDTMPKIVTDDTPPQNFSELLGVGSKSMNDGMDAPNVTSEDGITIQFYLPKAIFVDLLKQGLIDDIKDIVEDSLDREDKSIDRDDWDDDSSEDQEDREEDRGY